MSWKDSQTTTVLQQHIAGTAISDTEFAISIEAAYGFIRICDNSPSIVLNYVCSSGITPDPQNPTIVNGGRCHTAAGMNSLFTTTINGGRDGMAPNDKLLPSVNCRV